MQGQNGLAPAYYGAPSWSPYAAPKKIRWQPDTPRRHLNLCSVCGCLLLPPLLFTVVLGLLSFHVHFNHPGHCWFTVLMAFLLVCLLGAFALRAERKSKAERDQDPTWFYFLFVSCAVAWIFAVVLGLWNWSLMLPHYELTSLNTYTNVDVGSMSGSGVMDAGRLSFTADSYIDTSKAIGFKKVDTWCVAPVMSGKIPLLTFDFWAVGKNCCSGKPGDFHCGEVDGKLQLGGGVRVLNNAEIPWLTLATQQAETLYHVRVGHAIFFKNVGDPLGTESKDMDAGVKFFCLCSLLFFGLQFCCVAVKCAFSN